MKKCIRKCVAFVLILSMLLVIVPRNPFPSNLTFAKTEVELWNKNGIQILFSEDSVWEYGKDSTKINDPKNIDFLNNPEDMIQVLSKIKIGGGGGDEPETPIDAIGSALKLKFRKNAESYLFVLTNAKYKNSNQYELENLKDAAEQLKKKDIITSVVTEFRNVDTYQDLYEPTNGKWIDLTSSFQEEIYRMIVQGKSKRPYYAVLASNLSVVTLDKKPSQSGKTDTDQMVYRMQKKFHRNQLLLKMTR